uniref:Protein kinase domain-containing protein n=1 Tax=Hucho hucho TaxID=62062 RepID=A0A4W5PGU4_9TELE
MYFYFIYHSITLFLSINYLPLSQSLSLFTSLSLSAGYGLPVDLWALGVIVYILLCGFPPFRRRDRDQEELFQLIREGHLTFLSPYWDHISDSAQGLVKALLQVDPTERLTAVQTLKHPWIQNSTDQYRPVQTTTDHYRPVQASTNHYRPVQTSKKQYRPVQTSTDQYRPLQTSTDQQSSEQTSTDQHRVQPLQTSTDQHRVQPLQTSTDQHRVQPLQTSPDGHNLVKSSTDHYRPSDPSRAQNRPVPTSTTQ